MVSDGPKVILIYLVKLGGPVAQPFCCFVPSAVSVVLVVAEGPDTHELSETLSCQVENCFCIVTFGSFVFG